MCVFQFIDFNLLFCRYLNWLAILFINLFCARINCRFCTHAFIQCTICHASAVTFKFAERFTSTMHCCWRRFRSVTLERNSTRRRPFPRVPFDSLSRAKQRIHPFSSGSGCMGAPCVCSRGHRKTCPLRSNDSHVTSRVWLTPQCALCGTCYVRVFMPSGKLAVTHAKNYCEKNYNWIWNYN